MEVEHGVMEMEVRPTLPSTDSTVSIKESDGNRTQAASDDTDADAQRTRKQGAPIPAAKGGSGQLSSTSSQSSFASLAQSKSLLQLHVGVPDTHAHAETAWVLLLVVVLPLLIPLLFCAAPLQSIESGLWVNYTWWGQVVLDFLVYTFFIVGVVRLFIGHLPWSFAFRGDPVDRHRKDFLHTFLVYAIPHTCVFPLLAALGVWPVPFGVYLACGPIYLTAILFAYARIGLPWIARRREELRVETLLSLVESEPDEATRTARAEAAAEELDGQLRAKGGG